MNRRILLIDPDPAFQDVVQRELARYRGVIVMVEADGERAVQLALADPPTAIVLAVEEPEKVGFKVFQKCKKSAALAKVPIVLVTASVSADSLAKHRGLKTHADDYLDKRAIQPADLSARLGKLIDLGSPMDDELAIPVEDDIPMEIGEGDVVLDETVGDDVSAAHEFANEGRTVGGDELANRNVVDRLVAAETDAAFDALLGDEEPVRKRPRTVPPAPPRAPSAPPAVEAAAVPEPIPHVNRPSKDTVPPPGADHVAPAVPAAIHDGSTGDDFEGEQHRWLGGEESQDGAAAHLEQTIIAHDVTNGSGVAIDIPDDELVAMDEEEAAPAQIVSSPPQPEVHEEFAASPHDTPTVARAPLPAELMRGIEIEEPAPKPKFIESRTQVEPGLAKRPPTEPRSTGSGSHPAIDLGLERVAHDAESEQSGVYDRRALRKIGELERQLAQMKAELDRARAAGDAANRGGREREFLALRESLASKDKELVGLRGDVAARQKELADANDKLRQAQHARGAFEQKNAQLEQRIFESSGHEKAAREVAAQLEAAQRTVGERDAAIVEHVDARAQLERDLAARHQAALAKLRDELDATHSAELGEAVEGVRRANAEEHERVVGELTRGRATGEGSLRAELDATRSERDAAATHHAAEVERLAREHAAAHEAQAEQHAAAHAGHEEAHAGALQALAAQHLSTLAAQGEQHAAALQAQADEHAEARDRDAESHGRALAQLKSELDSAVAGHELKTAAARRERDDLIAQHAAAVDELRVQRDAALGEQAETHASERAQLAEGAKRAQQIHHQREAEAAAGHDAALAEAQGAHAREAGELRARVAEAERATAEADERSRDERDSMARTHAAALADAQGKHERALAAATNVAAAAKTQTDAEHARVLAQRDEEHAAARTSLESERDELRRGLSSARDAQKRNEGELASAVQTIADRNAELRSHAQAVAERDQRIAELRKEIESLEKENASYQDQVLRAYQKIKADEAMVTRARKAMAIALTVLDDQGNGT